MAMSSASRDNRQAARRLRRSSLPVISGHRAKPAGEKKRSEIERTAKNRHRAEPAGEKKRSEIERTAKNQISRFYGRCGVVRKRYQTVILCIVIVSCLMTACQNHYRENATPTGYEPGEIGQPQIMYEGTVYYYQFTGFDGPLPDGYTLVGEV